MILPRLRKKNIVVVRAGENSMHHCFLDLPYSERDYDVVVSYFDRKAYECHYEEQGVKAFFCLGGKWDGLYETFSWMGEALDRYEFIWLPDDDIDADAGTINRLFELMQMHNMAVAQPSLTSDSFFTHFLFINCPGLQLRRTNYVEIMVPCLRLDLLKRVMPHFRETMSGFGLDYIWCRLPESGIDRSGIFDSICVRHTRPVGKVLMSRISANGKSAKDEEAALNALYGIEERITPLCYGALTADDKRISGLGRTGFVMFLHHLMRLPRLRADACYGFGHLVQLVRRQLTRKITMEPLNEPFVLPGSTQQTHSRHTG